MSTKKLVKDTANKKLAGVCAGLANYFGIDVTIMRILWIIFAIMGSLGIWVYIALMLLLPSDK